MGTMQVAGTAILTVALIALTAACGGGDDAGATSARTSESTAAAAAAANAARRARLLPASSEPFKVRGSGFRARERVRVTGTATNGGAGVTRRVRATGRGTFVLTFSGIDACGGVEAAASGSRGSRASFQMSSLRC
jgi:hypothetical protein